MLKNSGIDAKTAAKIETIKQLRPLTTNPPWGIFFLKFEPKRLPVVAMRRILGKLVIKKRAAANASERASWNLHDLLFISSYGEGDERQISLAHFSDPERGDLPGLKVLGWDGDDTQLKLDHVASELRTKLRWPDHPNELSQWRDQWSSAFALGHREVIRTSQDLAIRLADLACAIRKKVNAALGVESEKGPLRTLMKAFQEALIHDLKEDDFADMYAQTIAYGLLSARVSRPAGLVADDVALMVPITNPFLRELMETFLHIGGRKRKGAQAGLDFDELGINDVVALLRAANMEAVLRDFGNRNPTEDPVIHFYELFLKEYDAKKRLQRGVFYTPRPVVSYIVRSVDELLRAKFGLEDGLADTATWGDLRKRFPDLKLPEGVKETDTFVCILDPATGTGTFLVEIIELIYQILRAKWSRGGKKTAEIAHLWNEYIPRHLLTRLHGYELMMAPYAIAHMKIGLKLAETGYRFGSEERARIYLTNSLEPPNDFSDRLAFDVPALAHESHAVNGVKKNRRFTVVVGNPPYSSSMTEPEWLMKELGTWKEGLKETKSDLNREEWKFLRFAQYLCDKSGRGIIGFIINRDYLDGVAKRRMRECLQSSFSNRRIIDLNGDVKGNVSDENVFDIAQGVCVTILSNMGGDEHRFHSCVGTRKEKYALLLNGVELDRKLIAFAPSPPYFSWVPSASNNFHRLEAEYNCWMPLNEIFSVYSSGIQTKRDHLCIHYDADSLWRSVHQFHVLEEESARFEFDLGEDGRDWTVAGAKADISASGPDKRFIKRILYRPFDSRFTYWTGKTKGFLAYPRREVMQHMIGYENYGMIFNRQVVGDEVSHFGVSNHPICHGTFYLGNKGQDYLAPLYVKVQKDLLTKSPLSWKPNFSANSIKALLCSLKRESDHFDPKELFAYIYAVVHSVSYRKKYLELLKRDFARLPFPGSFDLYSGLSALGGRLISLHLLEALDLSPITSFSGSPNPQVEQVSFVVDTVWIDKKKTQGFRGVPGRVWSFRLGGYQVCEKWLKDRKGRALSKDDITHYQKIVVSLAETIHLMEKIDEVIEDHGGWPGAFVSSPLSGGSGEPVLPFE